MRAVVLPDESADDVFQAGVAAREREKGVLGVGWKENKGEDGEKAEDVFHRWLLETIGIVLFKPWREFSSHDLDTQQLYISHLSAQQWAHY